MCQCFPNLFTDFSGIKSFLATGAWSNDAAAAGSGITRVDEESLVSVSRAQEKGHLELVFRKGCCESTKYYVC